MQKKQGNRFPPALLKVLKKALFKLLFLNKSDQSDCVGCIFRNILDMGSIFGVISMLTSCPHSRSPSVSFRSSLLLRWISLIFLCPLVPYFSLTVLGIAWADVIDGKFFLAVVIALVLIPALITCSGMLMMSEAKCKELNGLAVLVQHRSYFGVESFLSDYQVKWIVTIIRLELGVFFTGLSYCSYAVYCFEDLHMFDSGLIRTYSVTLSLFLLNIASFHFVLAHIIYELMFKRCFEVLKKTLITKRAFKLPLLLRLQKLQRLYEALLWNYITYNYTVNPIFLLNWTCLVCVVIISLTIDLVVGKEGLADQPIHFIYVIGIAGILAYIVSCGRINNLTRDIVRLLFKFPFSKLKSSEAAQLESLLTTMILRKPHLSASQVFVVRVQLLTTITSTIVTYVLVALQFHVQS